MTRLIFTQCCYASLAFFAALLVCRALWTRGDGDDLEADAEARENFYRQNYDHSGEYEE